MSEKHIPRVEHPKVHEKTADHGHHERAQKHISEQANKARQEKSAENLAKIQELAQAEAKATQQVVTEEKPHSESDNMVGMQHSLKATAYKRTLEKTQQKLTKPARAFSKVVHSPVVDKISNVSAQTVARPSGFLGGSIRAFVGSLILYYSARHYGFKYNYLVLIFLFMTGYAIGAVLELAVWFLYSRKRHYQS